MPVIRRASQGRPRFPIIFASLPQGLARRVRLPRPPGVMAIQSSMCIREGGPLVGRRGCRSVSLSLDRREPHMFRMLASARRLVARVQTAALLKKEEGASLVEYGLLVGLIAVVCIGAITLLGQDISTLFSKLASRLEN